MHRTLQDSHLKARALRRARELREVLRFSLFLAFFLFVAVHSTPLLPLSTIMGGTQYLCVNLFNETGDYIGCTYVEGGNRSFGEGDKVLAEFMGSLMEKAIERNPSILTSEQTTIKMP